MWLLLALLWAVPHYSCSIMKDQKLTVDSWTCEASSTSTGWFSRAGAHPAQSLSLCLSLSFPFIFHFLDVSTAGWLVEPTCMSSSSRVRLFPKIRHTSAFCFALLDVNVLWMDLRQAVYSERMRGEILCGFALTYQKQLWNPRHSWHMLHSECGRRAAHLSGKSRTKRILKKLPSEEQLLQVTNSSLGIFFKYSE